MTNGNKTLDCVEQDVANSNVDATVDQLTNLILGYMVAIIDLSRVNRASIKQSLNELCVAMSAVNIFRGKALAQDIAGLKATVNAFAQPTKG